MNSEFLGMAIRSFRLRRRQIHNGKPWTLDDLAVATDDDKGHLSRIERGTTVPNRGTLLRISEALKLSRSETEFVLRLGGFGPLIDPPGPDHADKAIRWLAKSSRPYLCPLTLFAVDMRVWYSNALWLRLMDISPSRFKACIQGRHLGSGFFEDCSTTALIKNRYRNYDAIRQRTVLRFRAALIDGVLPKSTLDELLRHDQFRAHWDAVESLLPQYSLTGEQSLSEVDYPGRGILRFDTWWCPLEIDHRFMVLMQMPHDVHTREALRDLRNDPRPGAGAPCPTHGYLCKQIEPNYSAVAINESSTFSALAPPPRRSYIRQPRNAFRPPAKTNSQSSRRR